MAIRPAHRVFRTVEDVKAELGDEAGKLYDLIWKRTVASQMKSAKLEQTSITINSYRSLF